MSKISRLTLSRAAAPLILLLLWYAVAFFMKAPLILPFPHTVLIRLFLLCKTLLFWKSFAFSFFRVISAFLISFSIGFITGFFAADFPVFKAFLTFPLAVIRVTPVIAFILIALFWFKSGMVPVCVAVLMALPIMITASEKGFEKNTENKEKLFKASCYGLTGFQAFRYIRLPSAMPSVLSGSESAFGLCWKVVAAGEVLSIPRFAVGTMMQKAQIHLETPDVLAMTTALISASGLTQYIIKKSIIKRCSKNH